MHSFPWGKRVSPSFGEVWYARANLGILDSRGLYRQFSFQVDTGAVVTLLERSAERALGLDIRTGRRVNLGGVGGGTVAYVHQLSIRFEDGPAFHAPIAIAERDDVPPLLGFLGIFDRFSFELDPMRRETRISRPRS